MSNETQTIVKIMQTAALAAGQAILEIYQQDFTSSQKSDGSPVTLADQRAEDIILTHLAPLNIPILAEESVADGKIPELGNKFFVVDPLDGTKEFIKKNHQFTINIALVENDRPVCGIVIAPALNKGFVGSDEGAFEFDIWDGKKGDMSPITVQSCDQINMLISLSHADPRLEQLRQALHNPQCKNIGSSLKLCMLANGEANLYPRFSPTCEWDIAAGQAVLEAAGGIVLTANGHDLSYGKIADGFRHPPLVAANNSQLALKTCALIGELIVTSSAKKLSKSQNGSQ